MKKPIAFFCIATLLCVFTNCKKETVLGEDIILLGKEEYVFPLESIIPDSLKSTFPLYFGNTPEGYIPPNIEGEYTINKKVFCHSNFIDLSDTLDLHLRISHQHNRLACVDFHEGKTVRTDTAFVMGHGRFFTLYMIETRQMDFHGKHSIKRGVIVTGEKTEQGIMGFRFGSIILSSLFEENAFIGSFKPGWYFIYRDGDDLAENSNWFNDKTKGEHHE